MRKKILAVAMVSAMALPGPAHANIIDDVTDWFEDAVSDTVSWLGGAASDSVSWVSGAWEDSVDWTEGAWDTVEDFYGDVRDAAGTVISYSESGIQTVSLLVSNAILATVNNYDYGLDTDDWRIKALRLQNKIDNHELLDNALFVGTHNSFNAKEYSTSFSYIDPNHKLSIYDQLDAGMVALELDVHQFTKANSFWVWEWGTELMLCHGEDNHTGCSAYDRSFLEGLAEIELWLEGNSEDVIFIYIEDHMDGDYDHAISFIEETIGDYVYRPTGNNGCESLPMDVSKQDILNSGKQVILWGGGDVCSASADWQSIAFGGSAWNNANVEDARMDICETTIEDQWLRYFEDRTGMSTIWGVSDSDEKIEADDMFSMYACGANFIGLDMVGYGDTDRISGAIWSWSDGEPNDYGSNEDCAMQWSTGRFNDASCTNTLNFACENESGDWYITDTAGPWSEGIDTCSDETNGEYTFSVPTNYIENQALLAAKEDVGLNTAWMFYSDLVEEGYWVTSTQGLAYSSTVGGSGGNSFDDTSSYQASGEQDIATVSIRSGSRIDAIGITYANGDSVSHGGDGGDAYSLSLASGEYITEVGVCSDYTSTYEVDTVHYVKLETNYGNSLSGGTTGSGTCKTVVTGVEVVGFYGRTGTEVDRLGVIYK